MTDTFFSAPILNSPYEYPRHFWELDDAGQPTGVRKDGRGANSLLNLVVEIKGRRGEDAEEKASTLRHYLVPSTNHHRPYGRWAAAEFTDAYAIEADFAATIDASVAAMIEGAIASADPVAGATAG